MDVDDAPTAHTAPKRGPVVRANVDQANILRLAFDKTPTPAVLEDLAKETGLSTKWIAAWFGRQRRKKRRAELLSTSESANTSLEVKKEVCENGTSDTVSRKKRQAAKTGKPAKKKVLFVTSENAISVAAGTCSGASVFDMIDVKMERYTPELDGPLTRTNLTLATDPNAVGRYQEASLYPQDAARSGDIALAPPLLEKPVGKSRKPRAKNRQAGLREHAGRSSVLPTSSPPSVSAAKKQRQRTQLTGEGPILRTQFHNQGAANFSCGLTAPQGVVYPFPIDAEYRLGHVVGAGIPSSQFSFGSQPMATPTMSLFPTKPFQNYQRTVLWDGGLRGDTQCNDREWTFMPHLEESAEFQSNAAFNLFPAHSSDASVSRMPFSDEPRIMMYHPHTRTFSPHGQWKPAAEAQGRNVSFLDPLHAPVKYLTDILDPICEPLGGYEKLNDLEGTHRQGVMEKLLDEELGNRDPFKAAMGLVVASKLGLRWE